ncbi:RNA polymerase sigma factor, sigma-70 family [Singulisphaera sp. GP187]|uniref:RNA polymerase sigma factor n=1 Tax=Singulisphaera sp. GP187 TaxID=1882752 RepID=UPI000927C56D|nr:RNA polymerase sigma factor [Singulisphaera sp. GP187]SIO57517.1 RNA polymerase sigma factor, sigma-70 family [Singulisphaera sp. GP187]
MIAASDSELLRIFVEDRDAKAFETLMARHGPRVWRVCRQVLGQSQDAEDAFQSTFLLLAGKASSICKRDSLGPWLHGVAHRIAVRSRVDTSRRRIREYKVRQTTEVTGDSQVEADEVHRALHEEIDRLPAKLREPIRLCYLDGRTTNEAAQLIGCPTSTVKERLARGRERLQSRLDRRGLTLTPLLLLMLWPDRASAKVIPPRLAQATLNAASRQQSQIRRSPVRAQPRPIPRVGLIASTASALLGSGIALMLILPAPHRGTWLAWLIEAARKACH